MAELTNAQVALLAASKVCKEPSLVESYASQYLSWLKRNT